MTQPLPYERDFDFEDFQSSHPSTPLPGDKVNVEFDQVAATIDAVRARIADLQRDDREVHNKVIGFDQLKDELRKGFTTPTVWAAGTSYEIGASVYVGRKVYAALVAHTSGANFNADNLTGKWYLLADFTAVTNVDQAAADAALAAKQSATSAAGSANAAQNSEVSAGASAATAAAARTAAGVSETNAAASASEAAATLAGTVKGPASSTTDNIALFSDATGKLLKDSGKKISDFGTGDMLAANDLSDLSSIPSSRANLVVGTFVADRTALKALDTTKDTLAYLKEPGCEGQFVLKASDFSAQVTADTAEAIYVAPASDPTGASGAWVRSGFTEVDGRWWGLVGDGAADDTAALKAFILAGLNAYPEMDQVIPSGAYKFTEKINLLNPFGTLRGKGQAVLKYTGPAITNVLDVSPAESYYFNQTIKDLWIQGNAGSQVLLRTHSIHHSVFENINLRDAHSGYPAMQTEAAVLNTYRNIRCSHNPAFDISVPYNGINFGSGTGSATQTIACIMENLIVEGVLSGGINLVNAAYNRFIGGSSEGNGGLGLYIVDGSDHNHINGMFFEANTGGDIYVGGNRNRFVTIEAVSVGGAAGSVEVAGDGNVFEGGRIKKITIDGSAVGTTLREVMVETIVDNGSFTVIENCYDWAGNRIPDKTPITIILSGPTSSRPLSPTVGQLYYDTTIQKLIVWNSAAWTTTDGSAV